MNCFTLQRNLLLASVVLLFIFPFAHSQTPIPLRSDISVKKIITVESDCVRIAKDSSDGKIYYARGNGDIYEVSISTAAKTLLYTTSNHKLLFALSGNGGGGFAIGKDGTFYLCGYPSNAPAGYNTAVIARGKMVSGARIWDTLAITEPYLKSNTGHDHLLNALEISPDGKYIFVNSGSRTDHGDTAKVIKGGREYPITSAIFRLPSDGRNIQLWNNEDSLKQFLFADGTRNTYDMAFSQTGELFGVDNNDVADDHEELNWIREGKHYGFPWRLGIYDNPQQFPNYDPNIFKLLVTGINRDASNYNDPGFPAKPNGIVFTDPVLNSGPDADSFRDTLDGMIKDASSMGKKIGTFTPHGSPLGITFDKDSILSSEYTGDMFVMTYNDSTAKKFAPFKVPGEDLLHIKLTKIQNEERYEATVTRIVRQFNYPVDAVLIKNKMYVIENGIGSSLWEVTLPMKSTYVSNKSATPTRFHLYQNYPNPFNPSTTIHFSVGHRARTTLYVYDMLGRVIQQLFNSEAEPGREYRAVFDAAGLASGLYIVRLESVGQTAAQKIMLLK